MSSDEASKFADLNSAKTLFLVALYALELGLGIFAFVALFHIIDEYNTVLLVLNLITFACAIVLYCILKPATEKERRISDRWQADRRFTRTSILGALFLSILRATWQVMVVSENAENISPVNEQEFYFTYLSMAILRVVFFTFATDRLLDILCQ